MCSSVSFTFMTTGLRDLAIARKINQSKYFEILTVIKRWVVVFSNSKTFRGVVVIKEGQIYVCRFC